MRLLRRFLSRKDMTVGISEEGFWFLVFRKGKESLLQNMKLPRWLKPAHNDSIRKEITRNEKGI